MTRSFVDARVDLEQPCWEWPGVRTAAGYGSAQRDGKKEYTHRWMWWLMYGVIPRGLEINHICHNRACMNPAHLELVSHADNMRWSAPALRPLCIHGHPLEGANLYLTPKGHRRCRACKEVHKATFEAKRRAA